MNKIYEAKICETFVNVLKSNKEVDKIETSPIHQRERFKVENEDTSPDDKSKLTFQKIGEFFIEADQKVISRIKDAGRKLEE